MRWILRGGLAGALLVLGSGLLLGQGNPPAPGADTTGIVWARRLLTAMHAREALLAGLDSGFAEERRSNAQKIPPVFFDSLMARARRDVPQLLDSLALAWSGQLPAADFQQVVQFYESPLGQRYATAESNVTLVSGGLAKRWGMREALEVMRDLMDKGLLQDMVH